MPPGPYQLAVEPAPLGQSPYLGEVVVVRVPVIAADPATGPLYRVHVHGIGGLEQRGVELAVEDPADPGKPEPYEVQVGPVLPLGVARSAEG